MKMNIIQSDQNENIIPADSMNATHCPCGCEQVSLIFRCKANNTAMSVAFKADQWLYDILPAIEWECKKLKGQKCS
jgi:hypothetical protein